MKVTNDSRNLLDEFKARFSFQLKLSVVLFHTYNECNRIDTSIFFIWSIELNILNTEFMKYICMVLFHKCERKKINSKRAKFDF